MSPDSDQWIQPTPVDPDDASLTTDQVRSWRERGFAFLSGLFPPELVDRLRRDALETFPAPGSDGASRARDFGSGGRLVGSRFAPRSRPHRWVISAPWEGDHHE